MSTIKALWHRHLAAWHRIDAHLAKQRGDLVTAMWHTERADRELGVVNQITGRLYS